MEENEWEPQIGDWVEIISISSHNSDSKFYLLSNSLNSEDKGKTFQITDMEIDRHKQKAYQIKGTGLRRTAFKRANVITEPQLYVY